MWRLLLGAAVIGTAESAETDQPAPPGSCGTFAVGFDYTGHDLKAHGVVNGVKSPADCCAACAAATGCNAWTLWTGGDQCYLKVSAAGATAAVNHTSGNYTCLPPACHRPPPPPDFSKLENDTDCLMRSLFVAYAARVNPNVIGERAQEMADALSGDPLMGAGCRVEPGAAGSATAATAATPTAGPRVYADAVKGSDAAAGTEAAPFQTVERAVDAIRAGKVGGSVALRAGVFRMNRTLELSAADSGLTIETNAGDSQAWLSGGAPLTEVTWKPVNTSTGANIWSADLSGTGFTAVPAMRWAGQRLQRARFPNSIAETGGVKGWFAAKGWLQSSTVGVAPSTSYNAGTATVRLHASSRLSKQYMIEFSSNKLTGAGAQRHVRRSRVHHASGRDRLQQVHASDFALLWNQRYCLQSLFRSTTLI